MVFGTRSMKETARNPRDPRKLTRGRPPAAEAVWHDTDENRPGMPVLLGRTRWRARTHQGPGRGADRARPRGFCDLPDGRRARAAKLRGAGRPGSRGSLQRIGRQALVRPAIGEPGTQVG